MKTVTYDEMLWKLVPVEPTKHMIDASALDDQMNSGSIRAAWMDMVEAAPLLASTPAPAQQELEKALEPRMSRACLDAWDKSNFTAGPHDAVHPMFLEAFSAGFKAAQHQEQPAPAPAQQEHAALGMYEHKCPNVTGHRGPSFVCQKAGHAVSQTAYCNGCTSDPAQHQEPPQQERKPMTEELVDYILQDDIHNRLTPRVVDIAYSAFVIGRSGQNKDDGGPCDWFNDTKPMVMEQLKKIRKDMNLDAHGIKE